MEQVVYVRQRNGRSEPKVLKVRDDGDYDVRSSGSPSSTALLIGSFQKTLCFEDRARSSFLLWDLKTKAVVQEIGYDGVFYGNPVFGFARTVHGDVRIVMLARYATSFATRIYRGENDNRNRAREAEEAITDGWGAWEISEQNEQFKPFQEQLARFSVSEEEGGCIYWAGVCRLRSRIAQFSVVNETFTILNAPGEDTFQRAWIGHGLNGELAVTRVLKVDWSHVLYIWSHRGAGWADITRVILDASQHSVCFVPLSFYIGRDGILNLLLVKGDLTIIRMRPINHISPAEELLSARSFISASSLPQERYPYPMVKFTRNRTEEEEEEVEAARAAKRRNLKNAALIEHVIP